MSDVDNILRVHRSDADEMIQVPVQEGSVIFIFPPAHSKAAAVVCDFLQQVYEDADSQDYLKRLYSLIERDGNTVQ